MKTLLLVALSLGVCFGQNPVVSTFPGAVSTDSTLLVASDNGITPLSAAMSNSQTTVPLASTGNFIAPSAVTIQAEIILCTTLGVSGYSGCTRGWQGTTPVAHPIGTVVYENAIAYYHNSAAAEIKAIETALGANLSNIPGPLTLLNDTSTGTTVNQTAKISSLGRAIQATTADSAIPVFVVTGGAGTSGSATLATSGLQMCQMDSGGATVGHFVGNSTVTNGRCVDLGATAPTSGWVIGIVQTAASANADAVILLSPGYNATSGSGGGGSIVTCTITAGGTTCALSGAATGGAWSAYDVTTGKATFVNWTGLGTSTPSCSLNSPIADNVVCSVSSTSGGGGSSSGTFTVSNDTGTGTVLNSLAKINTSGNAVIAGTSDTAVPVYIVTAGAGTSGNATLAYGGLITCQMDAAGATIGHFIGTSTATGGRCMDLGATAPTTGWVIGIAQTTAAANANSNIALLEGYNAAAGASTPAVFSQLGNGKLVLTSSTVITMDSGCSTSLPCPVRIGDTVYTFTSSATATISAGSATTYFYVDGSGTRTVAGGADTITCSAGCTNTAGTSFPSGVVQYGTWTAASGTWTSSGGYTAMAASLGVKPNTVGGYGLVQSGNSLAVDTTIPAFAALTDGATVTWAITNSIVANADLTFTVHGGSRTLNLTGLVSGGSYVLKLKQDATGGEGLTLGTGCTWLVAAGGGGAITPSTGANAVDVLAFTYDALSSTCVATFSKNFD